MSDLRVTNLKGRTPGSAPNLPDGVVVTGVATATSFSGPLTGNVTGNVTGNADTATYASTAGIATNAQGLTGTPNLNVGVVNSATSFSGDGINLTNVGMPQSTRTLQTWLFGGG